MVTREAQGSAPRTAEGMGASATLCGAKDPWGGRRREPQLKWAGKGEPLYPFVSLVKCIPF